MTYLILILYIKTEIHVYETLYNQDFDWVGIMSIERLDEIVSVPVKYIFLINHFKIPLFFLI